MNNTGNGTVFELIDQKVLAWFKNRGEQFFCLSRGELLTQGSSDLKAVILIRKAVADCYKDINKVGSLRIDVDLCACKIRCYEKKKTNPERCYLTFSDKDNMKVSSYINRLLKEDVIRHTEVEYARIEKEERDSRILKFALRTIE